MTTPTHVAADLAVFLVLLQIPSVNPNYYDLVLIIGSNIIDIDHLFSRPIYVAKRNPFIKHVIHKKWILLILISLVLVFIRPVLFLGIGLMIHMLLDYIYILREKV